MAFNLDDVIVGGQIIIGTGNPNPIESGDKRINGSMYAEGPVLFGGQKEFSKNLATLMVGRTKNEDPDCNGADHSLWVKGNCRISGDGEPTGSTLHIHSELATAININNVTTIDNKGDAIFAKGTNGLPLSTRFSIADALGKAFDMQHPSKGEGHRLSYACIEGPEIGVYYRGRIRNENVINLPYYWKDLVHEDSISVQLQPIGSHQDVIVKRWDDKKIYLQSNGGRPIDCFYHVYAERKDINPLHVEYEGDSSLDYPDPNHLNKNPFDSERNLLDPEYRGPRNTITK